MQKSAFLIAAPSSNTGKTTLTLGLLRVLSLQGLTVQPFKCGPDYLDSYLHGMAASVKEPCRTGINLDTFMSSQPHTAALFQRYAATSDVQVVEGVMGLFDGARKSEGSSAEIAKLLGIPVVLVINAKGSAYSVAPLIHGFKTFDPDLRIAGVIFNHVQRPSHYALLKEACADVGVEALGYVPTNPSIRVDERHLGLNISTDYNQNGLIEEMASHISKTVDLERLLSVTLTNTHSVPVAADKPISTVAPLSGRRLKIAIARDNAFNFLYHENLEALKRYGDLVFFSPLHDSALPNAAFCYIAGGYPELYCDELSQNRAMRNSIKDFSEQGGLIYAECGGLMYLGNSIIDKTGEEHLMCGALDLTTTMQDARLTLGYRKVVFNDPLFGGESRGHEFHYSKISKAGNPDSIGTVTDVRDMPVETKFYRKQNTIASYIHLYWGENQDFLNGLLSLH